MTSALIVSIMFAAVSGPGAARGSPGRPANWAASSAEAAGDGFWALSARVLSTVNSHSYSTSALPRSVIGQ